jgi:hypothetical protein
MRKIITSALCFIVAAQAMAVTEEQTKKRMHSVKKAINFVGKGEKKKVSIVENIKHMFVDGKVSGQFRTIYAGYDQKNSIIADSYATAVGGILKYELASLYGFNAAAAVYTSHDIDVLSGKSEHHNNELSSSSGSYTEMGEAYINYNYQDFNFRAGRQVLNTPLADSDDIRMIQNTFEAYVASYDYKGFAVMAGHINMWQGYDADLDQGWSRIGENGVNFGGIAYHDVLEFNLWYYNITKHTNALYTDFGIQYSIEKDTIVHAMAQYLKESELDNSGFATEIYGAMFEYVIHGLSFNIAYNQADSRNAKESFSGTGGGTLYTSMDTMILDNIAQDRKANAIVSGISYNYDEFTFLYAYGSFKGDKNSLGVKEHIVEQNIGFEYNFNDEFTVAAIYVSEDDRQNKQKTLNDFNRMQVMLNYNF